MRQSASLHPSPNYKTCVFRLTNTNKSVTKQCLRAYFSCFNVNIFEFLKSTDKTRYLWVVGKGEKTDFTRSFFLSGTLFETQIQLFDL